MRLPVVASGLVFGTLLLLVAGCETAPSNQAKTAAAPAKPVLASAPAPTITQPSLTTTLKAPTVKQIPTPKLSRATNELVRRFTDSDDEENLQHEVSDTTSFPSALKSLQPGATAPKVDSIDTSSQPPPHGLTADGNSTALVEQDWTGLVLIPLTKSLSKAATSDVRLTKVEAHPLKDGRVRVWTRIENVGNQVLPAEIACEFRVRGGSLASPYFYSFDVPPAGYRDVFFVSPEGELNSYTVLVRSADAVADRRD
jgi:hypothetical protein